jgi:hypothetical protein
VDPPDATVIDGPEKPLTGCMLIEWLRSALATITAPVAPR